MSYRKSDFWTPERTARLVEMWDANRLSASGIAEVLSVCNGAHVSRNGVLGKVHRMKLPHRIEGRGPRAAIQKPKARKAAPPPAPPPAPVIVVAPVLDIARLELTELTDATCKWPVGDPKLPGFGFCGLPVAEGHVYCPAHHHRSIRPPNLVSVERRAHAVA